MLSKYHTLSRVLKRGILPALKVYWATASATYPKYYVVAKHEVLVAAADLFIFITIVVHLCPCVERRDITFS